MAGEGGTGGSVAVTPPEPRRFTVVGSGDVLLHQGLWRQAATDGKGRGMDFRPLLAGVRPIVAAADLAICHLETPVGRPGGPFTGFPVFRVPPQIVPALHDTGFDVCSTASNHSLDGGADGVRRTLDALDAAGLPHAGTARDLAERNRTTLLTVRGVRVALLSFTFSFNGIPLPKGKPWLANPIDVARILADARLARQRGAEVVIVSLHWGTEYRHQPNAYQTSVARRLLTSADIDLILGHHAHVVQPFGQVGGKWVAFGHGNLVSTQSFSADTRDGVLSRFTFAETAPGRFQVTRAEALPTFMRLGSGPSRVLLTTSCVRAAARPLAAECGASARRTARVIRSRGASVALA
ncbi:MAG: CapA family protein [Hamadaea sp.]|nr:CapA family protein [Hamadaea sp.]